MASQKATVMNGLQQMKDFATQDGLSKLLPRIIHILHVFDKLEDEDIQVLIILKFLTNRERLARFSSMLPPEHENKGEQSFRRE
jgi:hypothetical protein